MARKATFSRSITDTVDFTCHYILGYITPADRLEGRHLAIHAQRELKLASARHHRKLSRQQASNSLQSN
jgi:hypothetical protein